MKVKRMTVDKKEMDLSKMISKYRKSSVPVKNVQVGTFPKMNSFTTLKKKTSLVSFP